MPLATNELHESQDIEITYQQIGEFPLQFAVETDADFDATLDAYFQRTVDADHDEYPSDSPDTVHLGLPAYIPDGFVDLGSDDRQRDPQLRSDDREQVWVDKQAILERFRPVLKEVLQRDYGELSSEQRALEMADKLALTIFFAMPGHPNETKGRIGMGNDKLRLSEMTESLCRHKALVFQVLGQAVGLEMQLSKGYVDGVSHADNFIKAGDKWYLYDVTQPDYVKNAKDQYEWRPGRYPVDAPPAPGEKKRYTVHGPFSGRQHKYIARDDSYWYVEHPGSENS